MSIIKLTDPKDIFLLNIGDIVIRTNLYNLIVESKQKERMLRINCTPQQGINPIGSGPNYNGVVVKSYGEKYNDRWLNDDKSQYMYYLKKGEAQKIDSINYNHPGNSSILNQPKYGYPIFLFKGNPNNQKHGIFWGKFKVKNIITNNEGKIEGLVFARYKSKMEIELEEDTQYQNIVEIIPSNIDTNKYKPKLKKRGERSKSDTWIRDPLIGKNAIIIADYHCECNGKHIDFISKVTVRPYVEAHHLIPMKAQEEFSYSLDVEPNIISLCVRCHSKLHHGQPADIKSKLERLYINRSNLLKECKIWTSFDKLFSFYNQQ